MQTIDFLASDIFASSKSCVILEDEQEGVYVFSSIENEILYIGASRNINKRLNDHRTNLDRFDSKVYYIKIYTGIYGSSVFKLERSLIKKLRPIYNGDPKINYNNMPRF